MKGQLWLTLYRIGVVGFAIWALCTTIWYTRELDASTFNWTTCALLALGMIVTQILVVEVTQHDGERDRVLISSTWIVAMSIESPVIMTITSALIATLFEDWRTRRLNRFSFFRSAEAVTAAGLTYVVFSLSLDTGPIALAQSAYNIKSALFAFIAAAFYFFINRVFILVEDKLTNRRHASWKKLVKDHFLSMYAYLSLILVMTGPLISMASAASPLFILGAGMPTIAVWYANRQRAKEQHAATHDALTGLGNRGYFWSRFRRAIKKAEGTGQSLAVCMLDVDHFKNINDTLGHNIGDLVITTVAHRLDALSDDVEAFRLGGDEFTLLVHNHTDEQLEALGQRILEAIGQPISGTEKDQVARLIVSTSVGIAQYCKHGDEPEELWKNADKAVYQAKETRNTYCIYDASWRAANHEDVQLVADMNDAVSRSTFMVYYQPKVNAKTKETVGVEALLRWVHPTRGFISPDVFIPLAESTGLILPLSELALRDALRGLAAIHHSGHDLDLSVNMSARLLATPYMLEWVDEALEAANIDPHRLILEITESTLLDEGRQTLETIAGLRDRGIRLSVDDYGTEYSTPHRLEILRPDELKIDKHYVMHESIENTEIVRSAINLCHNLGITVVAEGVETPKAAAALEEMGCDTFQGFLYAKPMPLHELIGWVKDNEKTCNKVPTALI